MTQATTPPNLGELDIPTQLDALYLLGDTLALFNSAGIRLLPGFTADFVLNHRTGQWVLCDGAHIQVADFAPEKAASQFADFKGESLRAILGGYARKAYQVLAPRYPGFTQGLLTQLLPEPVPVVPEPRPRILDLSEVFSVYGCSMQADTKHSHLTFAPPAIPVPPLPSWKLVFASITVFVAELQLTPWLLHVAACDPTHKMAPLLGALARHEFKEPEWGGIIPRLLGANRRREKLFTQLSSQPLLIATLLQLLVGVYEHPKDPEDLYDELPVFKILRTSLEKPLVDSSHYEFALACLIDGLEWLAQEADAKGNTLASLRFAQQAQIALQLLLERVGPPLTESWFSRVEARENSYSWSKLAPDQELDYWTVWYFANYAGSAAFAVKQHSAKIGQLLEQRKITNQLWTAIWRVLNQLRKALRLCYALSQQPTTVAVKDSSSQALALQNLLAHYQQILKELVAMIERSSYAEQSVSHWGILIMPEGTNEETLLIHELSECMVVHSIVASHGYGPEAVQSLGKLIGHMP
jgi:hypothetical protein